MRRCVVDNQVQRRWITQNEVGVWMNEHAGSVTKLVARLNEFN